MHRPKSEGRRIVDYGLGRIAWSSSRRHSGGGRARQAHRTKKEMQHMYSSKNSSPKAMRKQMSELKRAVRNRPTPQSSLFLQSTTRMNEEQSAAATRRNAFCNTRRLGLVHQRIRLRSMTWEEQHDPHRGQQWKLTVHVNFPNLMRFTRGRQGTESSSSG